MKHSTAKPKTKRPASPADAPASLSVRTPIRMVLADDHHVVRAGLVAIFGTEPDLRVVGEACDGEVACQLYFQLRPDVLVLDLRMPVLDGFGVVQRILSEDFKARILIMTTYDADEEVWRCLRAGALGYVLKDASHPEIIAAIRAVAAGKAYTTPRLAMKIVQRANSPELTAREREVLQQMAAGKTNKEIAEILGLGEGTVKTHLKGVLQKLGAKTRTEAARVAEERGLLPWR